MKHTTNGALLCSLVQIVCVVIVRVIVDGVLGVTIVVLIGHDEVLVNLRSHFCSVFSVTGDVLFTHTPSVTVNLR